MRAKEYLSQLEKLSNQIEQKQAQVKELRDMIGAIGSFDYSVERVQTSAIGNKVENDTIKLLTLESEIKSDIINYAYEKERIVNEIHALDDTSHIILLYKRYVEFKRLEVIAVEMGYAYQYTRELHGRALQNFSKFLHKPTKQCDIIVS